MLMQVHCTGGGRDGQSVASTSATSTSTATSTSSDQDSVSSQTIMPKLPSSNSRTETEQTNMQPEANARESSQEAAQSAKIDIRLLVRRREAGALIGKRGVNIKRMRETYKDATFNIPDTGNGPERVVCICAKSLDSLEAILLEIAQLFLEKYPGRNVAGSSEQPGNSLEDQVELKQLINSAYAGLLIGLGGQSIRKLRNDTKAAIKIYEMCCPNSDERVCAIKAKPPVVVSTIKLIHKLMLESQATIKVALMAHKPYDALNFDLSLVDKYGGYIPDDCWPLEMMQLAGRVTRRGQSIVPHPHPPHPHSQPMPAFASSDALMNEPHNELPYLHPRGLGPPTNFPVSAPFQAMSPLSPNPFRPQYQQSCESLQRLPSHKSAQAYQVRQESGMLQPVRSHRFQPYLSGADFRDINLRARQIRHLQDQQQLIQQQLLSCLRVQLPLMRQHQPEQQQQQQQQQPMGADCCSSASQMAACHTQSNQLNIQPAGLCRDSRLDPCSCQGPPPGDHFSSSCNECPTSRPNTQQLTTGSNLTPRGLILEQERARKMGLLQMDAMDPTSQPPA